MVIQRVLVTGGTGVIGAYVARHFVTRGVTPIIFTRGQTHGIGGAINRDITEHVLEAPGDIMDRASIENAIHEHRAQAIVHMASAKPWHIEVPFAERSTPRVAVDQIGIGTLNVLEAAVAMGVQRVVYASSKGVYGIVDGEYGPPEYQPLPATYRRNPYMLYGIGKVLAENLGDYVADHHGIEFVSIRFATTFGALKRGSAYSLEGLLDSTTTGEVTVRPFLDGQREDYVYNRDVAEGLVLTTLAEGPLRRAYNLGSGHAYDHRDIMSALAAVVPQLRVRLEPEEEARAAGPTVTDRGRCLMDNGPLRRDVGYLPTYSPLEVAFEDYLSEMQRISERL